MKARTAWTTCFLAAALALTPRADAAEPRAGGTQQQAVFNSEGFLAAHPDLRWRREGVRALEQGRDDEARTFFRRAARYGDKPSQAMLAELWWTGRGGPADRALAYAWMDLAAERGYTLFLGKREQYWTALDAAGRRRALDVGRPLFEEYRDAAAQPRLELLLKRAKLDVTGSRVGTTGPLRIVTFSGSGLATEISGHNFYDERFWEPERYWAWKDEAWEAEQRTGRVDILPLEVVREPGEAGADDR